MAEMKKIDLKLGSGTLEEIQITKSTPPHGFVHKRVVKKHFPLVVFNRRGKVVLWVGGRWLPANGPALWFVVTLCFVAGVIGGRI